MTTVADNMLHPMKQDSVQATVSAVVVTLTRFSKVIACCENLPALATHSGTYCIKDTGIIRFSHIT